uniref:ATP-dependent RNA helicase n=1 Tax=Astyanax mexicanus TaxID=7994 RepID=A0A3B1IM50_ASTMX
MRDKKGQEKKKHHQGPVKNFEKWKKRYDKTKQHVKPPRRKRDWEIERENIQKLQAKYDQINPKDVIKFSDFPLSKKTLRGLLEGQYRQPTEIQKQTIGFALQGKDVLGAAKTGSGKTLAFLIPDLKDELLKIHRTNIIICTPGRLLQHMDENSTFHASDLHMLVLDEADRILDMGFADTLNAIVENLPKSRQTLLFSATQTKSVKDLARLSLKNPEYVWVHEQAKFSTPATLEQSYMVCELHQKVNMLFSFLRSHLHKKIIVFFACCKEVQYLFRVFCRLRPGISVLALHGKQQQMKRVEVYNDFVRKKAAVLFATDIAARGLDFPAVNWVVQFDCPEDANTYIHRVGRTARYKEGGEALLILLPSEEKGMTTQLQEKKVPINKIQVNPEKLVSVQQKLEAFLAQEKEQKERAQRCFVSYLRSVYLMKNKDVFDVFQIKLLEYAMSLGLAVAPRVRFLSKAQKLRKDAALQGSSTAADCDSDEELQFFKARLRGDNKPSTQSGSEEDSDEEEEEEDNNKEEEEDSEEEEEDSEEEEKEKVVKPEGLFGADDDDDEDDDLKDLELLTVKQKDVFKVCDDEEDESEVEETSNKKDSRFKEAKKIQKRLFKVNTKKIFTDEGEVMQQWPPQQRAVVQDEEEEGEEETSGINVEAAKERLRREDQEFDKKEYSRKIKEKHREKRLKEKAARREASKQKQEMKKAAAGGGGEGNDEEDDENDDEGEDDGVVVYLAGASNEVFDPSTLPDPDKVRDSEDEDDDEDDEGTSELTGRKRTHSSSDDEDDDEEDDDEDDEYEDKRGAGRKKARQDSSAAEPLDTGLSLAEDEELVLHLLGNQS